MVALILSWCFFVQIGLQLVMCCCHMSVCRLVGLWSGLHKNYRKDYHETWMLDASWTPLTLSGDPNIFFSLSLTFRERVFYNIFMNFSGNNTQILLKKIKCVCVAGLFSSGFQWLFCPIAASGLKPTDFPFIFINVKDKPQMLKSLMTFKPAYV